MKKSLSLVIVTLVLSLTGCNAGDPHAKWFGLDAGMVHGRDYTPAHTDMTMQCQGNPQICIPISNYVPDSWSLDLYATNGDHGWTEVDQRAYLACKVNDPYPDCGR